VLVRVRTLLVVCRPAELRVQIRGVRGGGGWRIGHSAGYLRGCGYKRHGMVVLVALARLRSWLLRG
jgi:hypothetical protein